MGYYKKILLLLSAVIITSCGSTNTPSDTNSEDVRRIISGRIVDANGTAIQGASVKSGGVTSTTDDKGIFKLAGATDSSGMYLVSVQKAGYFDGFRRLPKASTGATNVAIAVRQKQRLLQFSSSAGATAPLENGASVSIPADGIRMESTNSPYNGLVDLYAYNLDPAQSDYADYFPGDCTAKDKSNTETSLFSHGINRIEMYSPSGEKLNLKIGATARLTYPIPQAIAGQAPNEIPIWHFDETSEIWKETAVAKLQGNSYVVDVEHFSTVNLDAKGASCTVIVTVVDCLNNPVGGATVSLGSGQGTTDGGGITTFLRVPIEMNPGQLASQTVKVSTNLNGKLSSQSLVLSNLVAGETRRITVIMNAASLSGKLVNCSGAPTSGMVMAEWANNGFSSAYANGDFKIAVPENSTVKLTAGGKTFDVVIPPGCSPYTVGEIKIDPTGNDCQPTNNSGACSMIWSFMGKTYTNSDYRIQGKVFCGEYENGTLIINGFMTNDISFRLSIISTITGIGEYEIGLPNKGKADAHVTLPNLREFVSTYIDNNNICHSAKGILTVEIFTNSMIKGKFISDMHEVWSGCGRSAVVGTITGTFTIIR